MAESTKVGNGSNFRKNFTLEGRLSQLRLNLPPIRQKLGFSRHPLPVYNMLPLQFYETRGKIPKNRGLVGNARSICPDFEQHLKN
jgi:hypothetical protein